MRLTPVEFEIMEIIWSRGSALVKDIHAELFRRKGLAYTTVMTEMDHMYKKGVLAHRKKGRAYLYTPLISRRDALNGTVDEFVTDFFHGSRDELARFIRGEEAAPEDAGKEAKQQKGKAMPDRSDEAVAAGEEEDVTLL
ncbi:MAG TPA: BlaI/MecI/CopY family transcriptional regulator [Acidobacteriota bacterium]|jgi:predicted transcriptional regulator|nr:BlaI/MecI/CopY family transcriptional regulator [Acidobacteriota bacterium]